MEILLIFFSCIGIMLSWNMPVNQSHATVVKYQLYAYQETNVPPTTDLWKIVGDVNALPLPMACTLTQVSVDEFYSFYASHGLCAYVRICNTEFIYFYSLWKDSVIIS